MSSLIKKCSSAKTIVFVDIENVGYLYSKIRHDDGTLLIVVGTNLPSAASSKHKNSLDILFEYSTKRTIPGYSDDRIIELLEHVLIELMFHHDLKKEFILLSDDIELNDRFASWLDEYAISQTFYQL